MLTKQVEASEATVVNESMSEKSGNAIGHEQRIRNVI